MYKQSRWNFAEDVKHEEPRGSLLPTFTFFLMAAAFAAGWIL